MMLHGVGVCIDWEQRMALRRALPWCSCRRVPQRAEIGIGNALTFISCECVLVF